MTQLADANTIISPADLRLMVGVEAEITDAEELALTVLHPAAEQAVRDHLGYDPVQRTHTLFLPFNEPTSSIPSPRPSRWEPDRSHTTARLVHRQNGRQRTLQLKHLPIRSITTIHEDQNGRFGQGQDAFPESTLLVEGDDYWAEFEEENLGLSGCIFNHSIWLTTPGSYKVVYVAGYSQEELAGRAYTASTTAPFTNVGMNASGIRRAVIFAFTQSWATYQSSLKSRALGKTLPGIPTSEKLGDYSYSINTAQQIASVNSVLPGAAADALAEFKHYGLART